MIRLSTKERCTACMACEAVCPQNAISQILDKEGFYYPEINHDICVECHACEKICPDINPVKYNHIGKVFAAWSTDTATRTSSSSGGIFSELAKFFLANNGLVVGAKLCEDNYVRHVIINDISKLHELQGSKYVQSQLSKELYQNIKKEIKKGKRVLFVGTGCQIAGFIKYFYHFQSQILTIDIVCHGVPSPVFFARFLDKIKKKNPGMESFKFRDFNIWLEMMNFNIRTRKGVKKIYLYGKDSFYHDAFIRGFINRESCFRCQYTRPNRIGDITLADFWGIGKKIPFHHSTRQGCSLVSINTSKGQEIFQAIDDKIFKEQRQIDESMDGGNISLKQPVKRPLGRDTFFIDAATLSLNELIDKYSLSLQRKRTICNRIIGKFKRIYKRYAT